MNTRLNKSVFVRHADDESVVWCLRTGASFVLKDAKLLLEEVDREWRSEWDIIDAYAAGLPVLSSRWASFSDIVEDGKTGFGYEFGSFEQLCELMDRVISSPSLLDKMKNDCAAKAKFFLPENAIRVLADNLL